VGRLRAVGETVNVPTLDLAPAACGAAPATAASGTLAGRLAAALAAGPPALEAMSRAALEPLDRRDRFVTLLELYDLHTGALPGAGPGVRHLGHPVVAAVKARLEQSWLAELDAVPPPDDLPGDALAGMRALAARDRLPWAYRWLAREASWAELVHFLAVEGGPDGGVDDLIAVGQVGLSGSAKLELARNYWDEMGRGQAGGVHTDLHADMARAVGMPRIAREELPVEALERVALGGLLATNRWLQPNCSGPSACSSCRPGRDVAWCCRPSTGSPRRRRRTPSTPSTPTSTRGTARTGWSWPSCRCAASTRLGRRGCCAAHGGAARRTAPSSTCSPQRPPEQALVRRDR